MRLADVLQFFTGARKIPATGFDNTLKVFFTDANMLPTASTCQCSITFSRDWGKMSDGDFKIKLSECILCSVGYGQV